MSLSKEQTVAADSAENPRQPKCTRCRHHGIIVPKKGHIKYCPFLTCDCWKCYLVTQRTQITALQRHPKKAHHGYPKNKEQQRPSAHPVVSEVKSESQGGTCSATAAQDGGASPSVTAGVMCHPSDEAATTTARSPLDLRSRPAAGGEKVAGLDRGEVLPFASSEEGPCNDLPFKAPHFGEFGQNGPLPFIHFPCRMPGLYPSSYMPCPNILLNMSWLPPVPAGLYNDGLRGPLMFPHIQPGAVHFPPSSEPGPPADCRQLFFTLQPSPLPELFQEELMSRQHPRPPLSQQHAESDTEELL